MQCTPANHSFESWCRLVAGGRRRWEGTELSPLYVCGEVSRRRGPVGSPQWRSGSLSSTAAAAQITCMFKGWVPASARALGLRAGRLAQAYPQEASPFCALLCERAAAAWDAGSHMCIVRGSFDIYYNYSKPAFFFRRAKNTFGKV